MTATVLTRNFTPQEATVVTQALQNVPRRVDAVIHRLDTISGLIRGGQFSRISFRDKARLSVAFHIVVNQSNASNACTDISTVTDYYRSARHILDDQTTRIDRLTPQLVASINRTLIRIRAGYTLNASSIWGWAAVDAYNGYMRSSASTANTYADLIYIGDAFFNPPPGDTIVDSVRHCQGQINIDLARVAVVVHEAIHWRNGTGGHAQLGVLHNPQNYQRYMTLTICNRIVRAPTLEDERCAEAMHQQPGAQPIAGRLRRPGFLG